jgi:hypothetical protein
MAKNIFRFKNRQKSFMVFLQHIIAFLLAVMTLSGHGWKAMKEHQIDPAK